MPLLDWTRLSKNPGAAARQALGRLLCSRGGLLVPWLGLILFLPSGRAIAAVVTADSQDFTLDTRGTAGISANSGSVVYSDSGDFTLDTTGGSAATNGNFGAVVFADSSDFTLDTTGGPTATNLIAGNVVYADSADFTLDTAGAPVGAHGNSGSVVYADSADFSLDTIGGSTTTNGSPGNVVFADSADFILDTRTAVLVGITNFVVMEGAATNLLVQALSPIPLAALQFDSASAPPPFALLSGVNISNTANGGLVTGTLQLNPAFGDAGNYVIGLRVTATNGNSSTANVFVTVVTNPAVGLTHWINAQGGSWTIADNWSAGLPNATNAAVIDLAGTYTVTVDRDAATAGMTVGASSGTQTVQLNDPNQPTLTLNNASVVRSNGVLNLSAVHYGDSLAGAGMLTIAGQMNWLGGVLHKGGDLVVANGGTLNINGTDLSGTLYLNRALRNYGAVNFIGGAVDFESSGTDPGPGAGRIDNEAGGTFVGSGDGTLEDGFNNSVFNNAGLFVKTNGGTTLVNYRLTFNNSGRVNLVSGRLQTQASVNNNGTINGLGGSDPSLQGVFRCSGGPVNLNAGSLLNQGALIASNVSGFYLNAAGVANFTNLNFTGADYGEPLTFAVDWFLPRLTLKGDVGGPGKLTITQSAAWTDGSLHRGGEFIVASNAVLEIGGTNNPVLYLNRTLRNSGTVTFIGGMMVFESSGTDPGPAAGRVENEAAGTFLAQGNGTLGGSFSSTGLFNNNGLFVKTNGGTTAFNYLLTFNNGGIVNIANGTLELDQNGSHTGQFIPAAGATLLLAAGTHSLSNNTPFGGGGTVQVQTALQLRAPAGFSTANVRFESAASVSGNFTISNSPGGLIMVATPMSFSGNLNIGGAFTVGTAGAVTDPGVFTLESSGVLTNSGSNFSVCAFFNNAGSVIGNPPVLTCQAPQITAQPHSLTVGLGSNAAFSVTATGTTPLTYQWSFNGMNIAGATAGSYTLTNAQSVNAGNYQVRISNIVGTVTSAAAVLTVVSPPSIIISPASQSASLSSNASFTVTATGTPPLSYQWQFDGVNLAAGTNSSLTLSNLLVSQAGAYAVVVTNAGGSITSQPATLTVILPPCLPAGIVGRWSGESNANDSINGNNGVLRNGATFAPGEVGTAFWLNGFDSYVDLGSPAALMFTNSSFSIECWVNFYQAADFSDDQGIVSRYATASLGGAAWIFGRFRDGRLWFGLDSNGGWAPERNCFATNNLSLNQWRHVAGTYNHTNGLMCLYVDGALNQTNAGAPIALFSAPAAHVTIGDYDRYDGSVGSLAAAALVDEVGLYNRALAADEIQAIYNAGSAGLCALVADADGNGLPDAWEVRYFGHTGVDPNADPDGDGASNLREYVAGTDPTNAASVFRILSAGAIGNDERVDWTTVGGHSYVVQAATNASVGFFDISPVISVGGTNEGSTNYLRLGDAARGAEYYRVRLGP